MPHCDPSPSSASVERQRLRRRNQHDVANAGQHQRSTAGSRSSACRRPAGAACSPPPSPDRAASRAPRENDPLHVAPFSPFARRSVATGPGLSITPHWTSLSSAAHAGLSRPRPWCIPVCTVHGDPCRRQSSACASPCGRRTAQGGSDGQTGRKERVAAPGRWPGSRGYFRAGIRSTVAERRAGRDVGRGRLRPAASSTRPSTSPRSPSAKRGPARARSGQSPR